VNAITTRSRYAYAATVAALKNAVAAAGNTIFAEIDQAAAAASVGMKLRPTMLIVFGNPRGGTPLMDAFPLVALDLPLKVLIWQAEDGVGVAYVPASAIAVRYGVTGADERIAAMDRALADLIGTVSVAPE
jgi:uncharacterized protein (DUF302 family)